jgi:hypothetical protein
MAFTKELPGEILKDYHGPDDFYRPQAGQGTSKTTEPSLPRRARPGHPYAAKRRSGSCALRTPGDTRSVAITYASPQIQIRFPTLPRY